MSWSFDEPIGTAGPTDHLVARVTIFNEATSTRNLVDDDLITIGVGSGSFGLQYDFSFSEFAALNLPGLNLAPGQSFSFVLGMFSPLLFSVELGTYQINDAFTRILLGSGPVAASNSFERTIVAAIVPEPGTLVLFATALFGLFGMRKLRGC
ncbi:MAG: PEP-CTERM sorting domain-containing protein [Gammaproteobacteria bacterium]|nr:PEP-CTERM sorting domain-containing protein [Gammaproteobacteria bacterium]